jgi:hypothetical protein
MTESRGLASLLATLASGVARRARVSAVKVAEVVTDQEGSSFSFRAAFETTRSILRRKGADVSNLLLSAKDLLEDKSSEFTVSSLQEGIASSTKSVLAAKASELSVLFDSTKASFVAQISEMSAESFVALLLAVALCLTVLWFLYRLFRHDEERPWKCIPGRLPVVGHAHRLGGRLDDHASVLYGWCDAYGHQEDAGGGGCFSFYVGGQETVVVCSEERMNEIARHRPGSVHRGDRIRQVADSVGATGVFSAEGPQWRQERRWVAAALSRGGIADALPLFARRADRLVAAWRRRVVDARGVWPHRGAAPAVLMDSVEREIGLATADAAVEGVLDRDCDFLRQPDHLVASYVRAATAGLVARTLSPVPDWKIPVVGRNLDGRGAAVERLSGLIREVVRQEEEKAVALHRQEQCAKQVDEFPGEEKKDDGMNRHDATPSPLPPPLRARHGRSLFWPSSFDNRRK